MSENMWETKFEMTDKCGLHPDNITILINPIVINKFELLMKRFKNIEWLAYLIGDNECINDIYIPEQTVTSVTVTNIKKDNTLKTIGVIHSHHGMGNSFSSTDDEWINQNNDISLCISKNGIKGHKRVKLPCGKYILIPVILKVKFNSEFNHVEFIKDINSKITENKIQDIISHNYTNFIDDIDIDTDTDTTKKEIDDYFDLDSDLDDNDLEQSDLNGRSINDYFNPLNVKGYLNNNDELKDLDFKDQSLEEELRVMEIVDELDDKKN